MRTAVDGNKVASAPRSCVWDVSATRVDGPGPDDRHRRDQLHEPVAGGRSTPSGRGCAVSVLRQAWSGSVVRRNVALDLT